MNWLRNNKKTWKITSRERDELLVMFDIYVQEKGTINGQFKRFQSRQRKEINW